MKLKCSLSCSYFNEVISCLLYETKKINFISDITSINNAHLITGKTLLPSLLTRKQAECNVKNASAVIANVNRIQRSTITKCMLAASCIHANKNNSIQHNLSYQNSFVFRCVH